MAQKTTGLLVGGGPFDQGDLRDLHPETGKFLAVDGGANTMPVDLVPDAIVGDLDSLINAEHWKKQTEVVELFDQNKTDLEKAITYADCRSLVCLGFIGGRFDQTLTVLHTCTLFPNTHFLFYADCDLVLTVPTGQTNWSIEPGSRVSLYPLTPCRFGISTGLKYPLEGLEMAQGKMIGTSNETTDEKFSIDLKSGSCFIIVDKSKKAPILDAFLKL